MPVTKLVLPVTRVTRVHNVVTNTKLWHRVTSKSFAYGVTSFVSELVHSVIWTYRVKPVHKTHWLRLA